jgi:L-cysteine desulfidase
LKEELVVALGCTEPVAIALAAATARSYVMEEAIESLHLEASGSGNQGIAVTLPVVAVAERLGF